MFESELIPKVSTVNLVRRFSIAAAALAVVVAGALTVTSASAEPKTEAIFTKGENGYGCHRIPAVVRAGNGDLLAFAEARTEYCGDGGHIDLVMKRSTDDGATWGDSRIVLQGTDDDPEAAATRGNPVPILDENTGRVVLLSTFNPADSGSPRTPYVQHSDDNGETWSEAKSLAEIIDEPDWGWYATGPGGGIQLTRGDHAGRLVAGVNFSNGDGNNGAALVYSDDGGETWTRGATDVRESDDLVPQELNLFERTDGGIYAAARENAGTGTETRAFAVSTDSAENFEAEFATIPDLVGTPKVQGSILRLRTTGFLFEPWALCLAAFLLLVGAPLLRAWWVQVAGCSGVRGWRSSCWATVGLSVSGRVLMRSFLKQAWMKIFLAWSSACR